MLPISGKVGWESPSNIALIKYWGKFGRQLPANPSLSITLKESKTITSIAYTAVKDKREAEVIFKLDGKPNKSFSERIENYLISICDCFPFLCQLRMEIDSTNSFPHSSGIASSASGMSALVLCLCSIESALFGNEPSEEAFFRKASYLSRLASGSACRSIYGGFAVWGKNNVMSYASDDYAVKLEEEVNPVFSNLHDTILIVDEGQKKFRAASVIL